MNRTAKATLMLCVHTLAQNGLRWPYAQCAPSQTDSQPGSQLANPLVLIKRTSARSAPLSCCSTMLIVSCMRACLLRVYVQVSVGDLCPNYPPTHSPFSPHLHPSPIPCLLPSPGPTGLMLGSWTRGRPLRWAK